MLDDTVADSAVVLEHLVGGGYAGLYGGGREVVGRVDGADLGHDFLDGAVEGDGLAVGAVDAGEGHREDLESLGGEALVDVRGIVTDVSFDRVVGGGSLEVTFRGWLKSGLRQGEDNEDMKENKGRKGDDKEGRGRKKGKDGSE